MKVLIVDDITGWVNFHKNNLEYLSIQDLQIDTAQNASSALSKIEMNIDEPYDIIFTDMQMESNYLPKMAGEWLIEQIQTFSEYRNTKIVIISASPNIERIAQKYNVEYLSKFNARNSNAQIYKQFFIS